jgi:hypothetical protein
MNAKYVIMDFSGVEIPIVLPPELEHSCVLPMGRPVSAGWCKPDAGWEVYGESLSLRLMARPEQDSSLLRVYFGSFPREIEADSRSKPGAPASG